MRCDEPEALESPPPDYPAKNLYRPLNRQERRAACARQAMADRKECAGYARSFSRRAWQRVAQLEASLAAHFVGSPTKYVPLSSQERRSAYQAALCVLGVK
jgi:hypothetical protein